MPVITPTDVLKLARKAGGALRKRKVKDAMRKFACFPSAVVSILLALTLAPIIGLHAGGADGWTRLATNGIDNPNVQIITPITTFKGKVYSAIPGASEASPPAPMWVYDGIEFKKAAPDGFGNPNNSGVYPLVEYQGFLYCGTANYIVGAELWRSPDGANWSPVITGGLGDTNNVECIPLGVQAGRLLVSFWNSVDGVEVYSYDVISIAKANVDGFGEGYTECTYGTTFKGSVYTVAIYEGAPVDRVRPFVYQGGTNWAPAGDVGFGNPNNISCRYISTSSDGEELLAGTGNIAGGQLLSYDGTRWKLLVANGIDSPSNTMLFAMKWYDTILVATLSISLGTGGPTGVGKLYRKKGDGDFEIWVNNGFGDPGNILIGSPVIYEGRYIHGTMNLSGFQVWSLPAEPILESIDPEQSAYGNPATLTGVAFGRGPDSASAGGQATDLPYVDFNGVRATDITSWSDTEIRLNIPQGATSGPVTVVTAGGISNPLVFTATLSTTYYFAEGTTRRNAVDGTFQEWISIENPHDTPTAVHLTYMLVNGENIPRDYTVPAHARLTVDVVSDVGPDRDVSVRLDADKAVLAERPMYFNYHNKWTGGHDVMGVPAPSTTYYFAEGTTRKNPTDGHFEEWICIQNPQSTEASILLTYMLGTGETIAKPYAVGARSRRTVDVVLDVGLNQDVSVLLESDVPVVAERPLYFDYHGRWPGGDDVVGTLAPSRMLYFAEGCTHSWANEWICIQNPNDTEAAVTLTYLMTGWGEVVQTINVPATSRRTVDVNTAVGAGKDVSVALASDLPVVAERPMYFDYQDKWPGGHDVMGSNAPSTHIFFAEGTTRNNPTDGYFDEWVCLQNPGDEAASVNVRFLKTDGSTLDHPVTLAARSRTTISANVLLGINVDSGIEITSDKPIVAERPMYFNYHGFATGGHDTTGYGI